MTITICYAAKNVLDAMQRDDRTLVIAFVDYLERKRKQPADLWKHNIKIVADDLSLCAMPMWYRLLIGRSNGDFSGWLDNKARRWGGSLAYPALPLSLSESRTILQAAISAPEKGITKIIVSCDFGKSRSPTAATCLAEMLGYELQGLAKQPNELMALQLQKATRGWVTPGRLDQTENALPG